MTDSKERMAARLFTRAVFPVMKVVLEDDEQMKKRFAGVDATVQFTARDAEEPVSAYLVFNHGDFKVVQGEAENPDVTFWFPNIRLMNQLLRGKAALPVILGLLKKDDLKRPFRAPVEAAKRAILVGKVFSLLLSLKLLMPAARPKDPAKQHLKVKLTFYMITTALSQYNKGGDPEMEKWVSKQPDRVYQISVEPGGVAAYLRVKAGKSKAGRGYYTRRRPFVHMQFKGVDGALKVTLKDVEFVEAVGKGYVRIEGSPEYAANLNDFMQRIQGLLT